MATSYQNDELMSLSSNLYLYTKKDIEKMYYQDYCYNLKQLLQSNYVKFEFLEVKDLLLRPNTAKKHWFVNTNNISLNNNIFNKLKLGYSIKKIGTYWPFAVITRPEVSQYITKYGNHRIYSLKLLQAKNELPNDFKVFCFNMSEEFLKNFAQDREITNFILDEFITVHLNKEIVNKASVKNRFINLANVKDLDEFTISADIDNMYDLWYACHSYSLYLRNLLIQYKIPPLEILNDSSKFQEWLKC